MRRLCFSRDESTARVPPPRRRGRATLGRLAGAVFVSLRFDDLLQGPREVVARRDRDVEAPLCPLRRPVVAIVTHAAHGTAVARYACIPPGIRRTLQPPPQGHAVRRRYDSR